MTALEFARELDGREYLNVMTKGDNYTGRKSGLVVVFGEEDKWMVFNGAFYDQIEAVNGRTIFVNKQGKIFKKKKIRCKYIQSIWNPSLEEVKGSPSWLIKSDIPHHNFTIMKDAKPFCIGLVFETKIPLMFWD